MKHFVEVGCADVSSLENFISDNTVLEIIEPNPVHLQLIRERYRDKSNVIVHPYAVWKERQTIRFYNQGVLSYVEGVHSPAIANYGYVPQESDALDVEARTFDEFDDGTIDVLDIDVEGCEWYVLEKMRSRPKFIVVEMSPYKNYHHAYFNEISAWLKDNLYVKFSEELATDFYKRLI